MTEHTREPEEEPPERGFVLELLREESLSGVVLTGALVVAVAWASLAPASYESVIHHPLSIPTVPSAVVHDLASFVIDGLMLVFFAAIGLEIGRERAVGALADRKDAGLPIAAALGGMVGAALSYLLVCAALGAGTLAPGWGIPMATDVAFTLAVLSLLGRRVPNRLRIFLLALAIADDVGSVVVLALVGRLHVGSSALSAVACAAGAALAVSTAVLARRRGAAAWVFVLLGLVLWWLLGHLGIEPTLAGVAIGVLVPTGESPELPGLQLERTLSPLSSYLILPLFALVAAGVDLSARPWHGNLTLIWALLVARTVGKAGGILLACLVAVRLGAGRLPRSISWGQLGGAALLCGIGFTVPLLFAEHAFAAHPAELAATKVALLVASLLCALAGLLVLRRKLPHR